MGYVIRMTQLGMSMDEGTVVEWLINEGEAVAGDEVVAVVESEKTSYDVECREEGVLEAVLVPEGVVVEPGTQIGVLPPATRTSRRTRTRSTDRSSRHRSTPAIGERDERKRRFRRPGWNDRWSGRRFVGTNRVAR